jgi:phage gp29-like protein
MQRGVPLPERKFIVHRFEPRDDNPYGTGLGFYLFWPVYFKRKGVVSWAKFCDRFGTPTPWGQYPAGAAKEDKRTLSDALRAFSNDGYIMTPQVVKATKTGEDIFITSFRRLSRDDAKRESEINRLLRKKK